MQQREIFSNSAFKLKPITNNKYKMELEKQCLISNIHPTQLPKYKQKALWIPTKHIDIVTPTNGHHQKKKLSVTASGEKTGNSNGFQNVFGGKKANSLEIKFNRNKWRACFKCSTFPQFLGCIFSNSASSESSSVC